MWQCNACPMCHLILQHFQSTLQSKYWYGSGLMALSQSVLYESPLAEGVCVLFWNRKAFLLCSATLATRLVLHVCSSSQVFIPSIIQSSYCPEVQSFTIACLYCQSLQWVKPYVTLHSTTNGAFPQICVSHFSPQQWEHSAKWSTELLNC